MAFSSLWDTQASDLSWSSHLCVTERVYHDVADLAHVYIQEWGGLLLDGVRTVPPHLCRWIRLPVIDSTTLLLLISSLGGRSTKHPTRFRELKIRKGIAESRDTWYFVNSFNQLVAISLSFQVSFQLLSHFLRLIGGFICQGVVSGWDRGDLPTAFFHSTAVLIEQFRFAGPVGQVDCCWPTFINLARPI